MLRVAWACLVGAGVMVGGCATGDQDGGPGTGGGEAGAAAQGAPGLRVGDRAPDAIVYTRDGSAVSLADLYGESPLVVTFYRGGWCPYCNRAMSAWQQKLPELTAAGGRLVALTPESPDHAAETAAKNGLAFEVYSDNAMEAARAYRVFFEVDPETRRKYRGYGIDLAAWNATGDWTLAAPGLFVIDRAGIVRHAWAEWDYTVRADPDEAIAVVRRIR